MFYEVDGEDAIFKSNLFFLLYFNWQSTLEHIICKFDIAFSFILIEFGIYNWPVAI